MTRRTAKVTLVSLSLAATLGSWAVLARDDDWPAPATPEPVVQTLDLPPIPTVARPPTIEGFPVPNDAQVGLSPDLPPIPRLSAPVPLPQPITRTRSSR